MFWRNFSPLTMQAASQFLHPTHCVCLSCNSTASKTQKKKKDCPPQPPLPSDCIFKQKPWAKLKKGLHISLFSLSPVHSENLQPDLNGLYRVIPNVKLISVKGLQVFFPWIRLWWSDHIKSNSWVQRIAELFSSYTGSIFINANIAFLGIREAESRFIQLC